MLALLCMVHRVQATQLSHAGLCLCLKRLRACSVLESGLLNTPGASDHYILPHWQYNQIQRRHHPNFVPGVAAKSNNLTMTFPWSVIGQRGRYSWQDGQLGETIAHGKVTTPDNCGYTHSSATGL